MARLAPIRNSLSRPMPPAGVADRADELEIPPLFLPAPEVLGWLRATFIEEAAPLYNPDHAHLAEAEIGVLWTNVPNRSKQMRVLATAEKPMPPAASSAWGRARWQQQIRMWFGAIPDFILTFDAPCAAEMGDVDFCAVVEHELYHCAQAKDEWDVPRFHKESGRPIYAIKGHDVEEHVPVVERYGAGILDGSVARLVEAARRGPTIGRAAIAGACGTCIRRAA